MRAVATWTLTSGMGSCGNGGSPSGILEMQVENVVLTDC